ncbi:MAG: GNAT family N-acetyltransferase [Anaerolineaceae bacterium]|nr:GNAT family N-acetyltransferase [Anaerolineaceae bacterium]
MTEIITLTEKDDEIVRHLMWKAFAPTEKRKAIDEWTLDKPMVAYAIKEGDRVVSQIHIVESPDNRIRGAKLKFGGIANVVSLPEFRRNQHIRKLFKACFEYMRDHQVVFSALAPFSYPFYEKFGYVLAEHAETLTFAPAQLKPIKSPPGLSFREMRDEDVPQILDVQRTMGRFGSRVFLPEKKLIHEHAYVIERAGKIVGYVQFHFSKLAEWRTKMTVSKMFYVDDEVVLAIVDLIYRESSQLAEIEWVVAPEFPGEYFITQPGHITRKKIGNMMTRVILLREFCEQIRVPVIASEPVVIQLDDKNCPWNSGVYKLVPVSGRLELRETDQAPEITFTDLQFSHAVSGFMTANTLHSVGELKCERDAAERFTRIFPADTYISYYAF